MSTFNGPPEDLITGLLRQSYAGAVRQRLLAIERAVQSGQRHESIVLVLEQEGMKASMGTFRKSLSRARIWWRRQLLMQMATTQEKRPEMERGRYEHLSSGTVQFGDPSHPQASEGVATTLQIATRVGASASSGVSNDTSNSQARQQASRQPAAGARRVDLDQFFQRKSVFTKS